MRKRSPRKVKISLLFPTELVAIFFVNCGGSGGKENKKEL